MGGEVVLGILERRELAVAGVGQRALGSLVSSADRELVLSDLARRVVDGFGDAVGAWEPWVPNVQAEAASAA